ncbi:MAG: hypothetical protein ACOYMA_07505 [Bacteroidia bacterium]
MSYIVYLLFHEHKITTTNISIKNCGVYDCEKNIEDAIEILRKAPGFKETPLGFKIVKFILNKTRWLDGFTSLIGDSTIPEDDSLKIEDKPLKELCLKEVFLLTHFFEIEQINGIHDECRYIGVYSNEEETMININKLSKMLGFKDYKNAFGDASVRLNEIEWLCGYATTD